MSDVVLLPAVIGDPNLVKNMLGVKNNPLIDSTLNIWQKTVKSENFEDSQSA